MPNFIISRVITDDEAKGLISPDAKQYVRVLDVESEQTNDYQLDELEKYVIDGVISLENATIVNKKLTMVNGGLENYGKIIANGTAEAEIIELKPVALVEYVDDSNTVIGYLFASPDGATFDYSLEEAKECCASYGCANGVWRDNENGGIVVCSQKPLLRYTMGDEEGAETAEDMVSDLTPFMKTKDDAKIKESPADEPLALPVPEPVPEPEPEALTDTANDWMLTIFTNGKKSELSFSVSDTTAEFEKLGYAGVSIRVEKGITVLRSESPVNNTSILSIKFPDCIDIIGRSFCENWSALTTATLGANTAVLMPGAFNNCSNLISVIGLESVKCIDDMAFANCRKLGASSDSIFLFGEQLTIIGKGAFYRCVGFKTLELPDSVEIIRSFAFAGMAELTSIKLPKTALRHLAAQFKVYRKAIAENTFKSDTVDCIGVLKDCPQLMKINMKASDVNVFGDFMFKGCNTLLQKAQSTAGAAETSN